MDKQVVIEQVCKEVYKVFVLAEVVAEVMPLLEEYIENIGGVADIDKTPRGDIKVYLDADEEIVEELEELLVDFI